MNKNLFNGKLVFAVVLILAAAFTRLIPHYPNFTAVGAIALFGGTYLPNKKLAFIVPFAAMILTDLIIGFHPTMWAVYLSFGLIVMIGMQISKNKKITNIIIGALSASVLFFVITNFAQWITDPFYAKTGAGLAFCYTMAIPFFSATVLGDMFYVAVLFGAFELANAKILIPQKVKI
ncbi:MAG: hypothetical protein P4L35_11720 [Ignavibacteriaceae bacterium]|nr:hypothetical protein [Ignavibacteriaceae bacterium]